MIVKSKSCYQVSLPANSFFGAFAIFRSRFFVGRKVFGDWELRVEQVGD